MNRPFTYTILTPNILHRINLHRELITEKKLCRELNSINFLVHSNRVHVQNNPITKISIIITSFYKYVDPIYLLKFIKS